MTTTLYLHVGEPKTGTTYLQMRLDANRTELAADGMLVPGRRIDQIRGAQEVMGRPDDGSRGRLSGRWQQLADQVIAFDGRAAVISMESLIRLRPPQAEQALAAFPGLDVQVVLTLRDLARIVPAQWQESLQFGNTWTLDEYLAGVMAARPRSTPGGRDFWAQHDVARELRVWGDLIGPANLTVVTLPAGSSPPEVLWERFAAALGLPAGRYSAVEPANPSLGAVSAELMRRVNAALPGEALSLLEYGRLCRNLLSKQILAERAADEPKVSVPEEFSRWAEQRSVQIAELVSGAGTRLVGDLADLRSAPVGRGASRPGPPVAEPEVTAAAVEANVGLLLAARDAAAGPRRRPPGPDD